MVDRERIGQILVDLQVLTPMEVACVLQAMRRRGDFAKFGQVAKDMGLLQDEHVLAALAVQMQLFPKLKGDCFPNLLDRLRQPVRTSTRLDVRALRQKLAKKKPAKV